MGVWWYLMAACLGYAYALSGRVAEAVLLLEQALGRVNSTIYIGSWNALCEVYLSEAYVLAGRSEQATQLAERTFAHATEQNMRGKQAWTLRLLGIGLGTLYMQTGRQEQARTALATAIEIYRAMDMTFWLPQAEAALVQVA